MLPIFFSLLGILVLLLSVEVLWVKQRLHIETARKIVHISSGVFMAFWPFWMSWQAIQIIAVSMFVVILLSHRFGVFNSIHGVPRLTRGELFFPLGIALAAFVSPDPAFFAIAILNLALADGLASVVGRKFGVFNGYYVFSHRKSIAGTLTCFAVSAIIFSLGIQLGGMAEPFPAISALFLFPLLIAGIENISFYGLDNLTIPATVIVLLGII